MSVSFTDVDKIYTVLPDLKDVTDLSSADIIFFAENAEAEVFAVLNRNYDLPINDTVPLLESIVTDITIYRILSRRIFTRERLQDSPWPMAFKEARKMVEKLAEGEIALVNSAGNLISATSDVARIESNTQTYHQTFWEGSLFEQIIDKDKLDDQEDDRDL